VLLNSRLIRDAERKGEPRWFLPPYSNASASAAAERLDALAVKRSSKPKLLLIALAVPALMEESGCCLTDLADYFDMPMLDSFIENRSFG